MTLPRMKAPWRISVPGPIQVGPMMLANGGNFAVGCSQTLPSTCTPGGKLRTDGGSAMASSATAICLNHSHGGTSGRKWRTKCARDLGREKKSEAFIQRATELEGQRNRRSCRRSTANHV